MEAALQGELGGFTLTDVLMFVSGISKSGVLVIASPAGRLEVDVCEGSVAAARVGGSARATAAEGAPVMPASDPPIDEEFPEYRAATAEALATGSAWTEGTFTFLLCPVAPGLAMPIDAALAEARLMGDTMLGATSRLGPPGAVPFRAVRLPGAEAVLTRDQWAAVALADGTRTLAEIVAAHPGGRLAAWASLGWLAGVGLLTSDVTRRPEIPPPDAPAVLVGPATPSLPELADARAETAFVDRLLEVRRSE